MGSYSGTLRLRATQANTVASFIETANTFWSAIEATGMQRVAAGDYAGQAGRLTSGTPGPDQTQITALGTTSGSGTNYFNVYKHPNLALYLIADVFESGFNVTSSRWAWIRPRFFRELDGAGSHKPGGLLSFTPNGDWFSSQTVATGNDGVPTTYKNMYMSCQPDHFWVCGESLIFPAMGTSGVTPVHIPDGQCPYAFGVFADLEGAGSLLITAPSFISNPGSSVFSGGYQQSGSNAHGQDYRYQAQRYWTAEPGVGGWTFRGGAAAGFLIDAATPASNVGTRAQQAQLYIGGALRKFDFGFVGAAAVADTALVQLNLNGAGEKQYRMLKGFGTSNPAVPGSGSSIPVNTMNSHPIMPWASP